MAVGNTELSLYRPNGTEIDVAWNQPLNVVGNEKELNELLAANQELFAVANQQMREQAFQITDLKQRIIQLKHRNHEQRLVITNGIQTVDALEARIRQLQGELAVRGGEVEELTAQLDDMSDEQVVLEQEEAQNLQELREQIEALQRNHTDAIQGFSNLLSFIAANFANADNLNDVANRITHIVPFVGQERADQIATAFTEARRQSDNQITERTQVENELRRQIEGLQTGAQNAQNSLNSQISDRVQFLVNNARQDRNELTPLVTFLKSLRGEIRRELDFIERVKPKYEDMTYWAKHYNYEYSLPESLPNFDSIKTELNNKKDVLSNKIEQFENQIANLATFNNGINSTAQNETAFLQNVRYTRDLVNSVSYDFERNFFQNKKDKLSSHQTHAEEYVDWCHVECMNTVSIGLSVLTLTAALPLFICVGWFRGDMKIYQRKLAVFTEMMTEETARVNQFIQHTFPQAQHGRS